MSAAHNRPSLRPLAGGISQDGAPRCPAPCCRLFLILAPERGLSPGLSFLSPLLSSPPSLCPGPGLHFWPLDRSPPWHGSTPASVKTELDSAPVPCLPLTVQGVWFPVPASPSASRRHLSAGSAGANVRACPTCLPFLTPSHPSREPAASRPSLGTSLLTGATPLSPGPSAAPQNPTPAPRRLAQLWPRRPPLARRPESGSQPSTCPTDLPLSSVLLRAPCGLSPPPAATLPAAPPAPRQGLRVLGPHLRGRDQWPRGRSNQGGTLEQTGRNGSQPCLGVSVGSDPAAGPTLWCDSEAPAGEPRAS